MKATERELTEERQRAKSLTHELDKFRHEMHEMQKNVVMKEHLLIEKQGELDRKQAEVSAMG